MKKVSLLIVLFLSFMLAGCPPDDQECDLEFQDIVAKYKREMSKEGTTEEEKEELKKQRDAELSKLECYNDRTVD